MIIIGVDPGSCFTGWGVIRFNANRFEHMASGRIALAKEEHSRRLVLIYEGLAGILQEFKPNSAGIESVFVHKNVQSALKLGQARGAALVALGQFGLTPHEISPREVKQSVTGHGGAGKDRVNDMVTRILGVRGVLKSDAADALAVAISCCNRI